MTVFPSGEHENIGSYIHILAGLLVTRASFSTIKDNFLRTFVTLHFGKISFFFCLRSLKTGLGGSVKNKGIDGKIEFFMAALLGDWLFRKNILFLY